MKTFNLYGEIAPGVNDLKTLQDGLKWLQPDEELHLRINSPGGSIIEGFAMANFLDRLQNKIVVHIDGWAASMASLICMVGDEIHAPVNAWIMIHNPWASVGGDAEELRKMADMLDEMKKQSVDMYLRCGGKKKTRKEIEEMMDAETWMTATEAHEIGFVTHLEAAAELAACWDVSKQSSKAPLAALAAITKKENTMPTFVEWLKSCPIAGGSDAGLKELAGAELQGAHKIALDEAQAKVAAAHVEVEQLKSQIASIETKMQEAATESARLVAAAEAAKAEMQARHEKLMGGHNKPVDKAQAKAAKYPATAHYLELVDQLAKELKGDVEAATSAAVKKYPAEFSAMVAEHPVKA